MGDEFTDFVQACSQRLYRVAFLLTADHGRAEDLTQDALARTYLAWRRIRNDDAYAYTRRVLVNLHNDWWRRHRWRERLVPQVPERHTEADIAGATTQRYAVARALQRLTPRERSMIIHRYFLDLTEQQTATELGVSVGTVKSMTARALAKLRFSADLGPERPTGLVMNGGTT